MLAPSRKRPLSLLIALSCALLLFLYHRDDRIYVKWTASLQAHHTSLAANRTLGFGAIVVVSRDGSERRHALLQAANVTNIDLTIPVQPQWTEGDVERFRDKETGVQKGSALAWLGHHNALQWFLNSSLDAVLVLEDDVDWDIRLRSVQIPLAASALRTLLPSKPSPNPFATLHENYMQYWGDSSAWDLLYLGHCGDYFNLVTADGPMSSDLPLNMNESAHVVYQDPTLPIRSDLHPFTQRLFDALHLPAHSRAFHRSRWPLCSFGYAITRPAAIRLMTDLAPPKLRENGPRAFDVALLHACIKGLESPSPTQPDYNGLPSDTHFTYRDASPGLRCWTLNSELFHHMPGHSQIAQVEEATGTRPGVPPVDLAAQAQVVSRNETSNIGCGFWSGAFRFTDGDTQRLHFLQEEVGRKGKCLKEGRDTI